jgi:putative ATP-dependent endonuclease of OLD family
MKITKVTIDNYKSIKYLEFNPNKGINAFVGSNSTGKSNIFEAITWLLAPVYPSFNSTKKEDRFLGNDNNKIKIKLEFDDGNYLELAEEWTDSYGRQKSGLNYTGNYCNSEQREQYCCAYLDTERKILDYLPSSRWTLVGRILQEVNKKFLTETHTHKGVSKDKKVWLKEWLTVIRDTLLFSVKDTSGQDIMKKFLDILQEESAKQLNRPKTDLTVDLSLYDPWNFYKTLQLIVKEPDMDLEFQASNLGMGVQASISIAILKAYSELNLANKSPIFIDEPELYLHPQAQRNFYRILQDLAKDKYDEEGNLIREGTQIFYTTHSPNFLSAGNFDSIYIVRKTRDDGTYLKYGDVDLFIEDISLRLGVTTSPEDLLLRYKNAYENTGDTQKTNEGFFAKKIILVEGQTEALLLPLFFDYTSFDYIKEGISIVRCGNKSEIDRFFRLYSEFGIPCYIIFDGDKHLEGTDEEEENIKRNKAILSLFESNVSDYPDGDIKNRYLGFEDELENNLGFQTSDKGLNLYIKVKEKLKDGSLTVPTWISEVENKVTNLLDHDAISILKKRTTSN